MKRLPLRRPREWFRSALLACVVVPTWEGRAQVTQSDPAAEARELREILRIRELSAQEAARGLPVRVEGVLTYYDPSDWKRFVQDEGAGIYISVPEGAKLDTRLTQGSRVEIEGVTGPGDYAPIIVASHISYVGEGLLPAPRLTSIPALLGGTEDSQWIAVRGVVQSQTELNGRTVFSLWTPDAVLKATLPSTQGSRDLVDATVEIGAVAGTIFNEHLRFQGVELLIPDWSRIRVLEPAPAEIFALPANRVSSLLRYHPGASGLHRFRFEGVATLARADGTVFVQDDSGAMLVQLRDPEAVNVKAGDVVSVVGFPTTKDRRSLHSAVMMKTGGSVALKPSELTVEGRLNESLHASLVTFRGRVVGQSAGGREDVLTVEFGDAVTDAVLERSTDADELEAIGVGSEVSVTGVYVAQFDDNLNVRSFRVLLRSPRDVTVLARPAWWTLQTTRWVLAGLAFLLVGALLWGSQLRREVRRRTRDLSREIDVRKVAEDRLAEETVLLQAEVEERRQAEIRLKETHEQLLILSRQAGMAEVATTVLHNVGNVLNSVNVSATLVADLARRSKTANVARLVVLLEEHRENLAAFLAEDPRGRTVQPYLRTLSQELETEKATMLAELEQLRKNIDHIKEIVAMQQSYARTSGFEEALSVTDLVDDAIRLNAESLTRHDVSLVRHYESRPVVPIDKHKALQILVNLIRNAKNACDDSGRTDKRIEVRVSVADGKIKIAVVDNGIGIPPENLTSIFNYGFTTRANGHGFGLHSGALAAKELGGSLTVRSDGTGCGAEFVLSLPQECAPSPS